MKKLNTVYFALTFIPEFFIILTKLSKAEKPTFICMVLLLRDTGEVMGVGGGKLR